MIDNFKSWLQRPFATDMDAAHWFYFFGLVMVISIMWALIMRHIEKGIPQ